MERTNHHDLGLGLSKVGNEGHYIYTSILTGVTHQFHSSCQQEKDLDGMAGTLTDQISQRTAVTPTNIHFFI